MTLHTAVITGGGSGIGSMIAAAYVQNGAKVYIASRKEKQLKEVSRNVLFFSGDIAEVGHDCQMCDLLNKKGPGSCHYFVADITVRVSFRSRAPPHASHVHNVDESGVRRAGNLH